MLAENVSRRPRNKGKPGSEASKPSGCPGAPVICPTCTVPESDFVCDSFVHPA